MARKHPNIYIGLSWLLLIIGAIISVGFLVINYSNSEFSSDFDYEATGQFGDYFGGVVGTVFALAGTILVFASFVQQQRRNTLESFERNYYEMLRVHEDIVREMNYEEKKSRDVFPIAIERLRKIYLETLQQLTEVERKAKNGTLNLKGFTNDNIAHFIHENGKETMAIIISVGILYYGSGEFFLSSPSDEALEAITNEVKDNLPDFGYEPMDNVLGHYYRQMYHTVKYVLQPKWLTEEERYGYVKLLRAQMSDYEQMMLYYNSLSINGFAWKRSKSKTEIEKMSLIARFRLIKNIPYHYDYFYFHPSDLFVLEKEAWKKNGKLFFENEIYTM